MTSKSLSQYADFRRSLFDPKGDLDPASVVVRSIDLIKAADTMGPFPELVGLPGGSFNTCHHFETPDGPYVLRVPLDERLASGLLAEEWAANAANEVHFPTVVPILTDTSHYLVPFSFQILPFVEGESAPLKLGHMARLHQVSLDGYGPIDPRSLDGRPRGLFNTWESYLTTRLDDHIAFCIKIGAMTVEEGEQADDLIRGLRASFLPVLLHNDLSPNNLIAGRWIDWESSIAGDPIYELASYCAFRQDQPVEQLIHDYHAKGNDVTYRFWVYYLRIVLARTVHRHRFGIVDSGKYPKASSRIQLALERLS